MTPHQETLETNPSYNIHAVMESAGLTTTLDQYWRERETTYAEILEQLKTQAASPEAERRWRDFCAYRTGFLKRFLKAGVKAAAGPLRDLWGWKLGLVREARQIFESRASVEIWIPFAINPLKVVRSLGSSNCYDIVTYPAYGGLEFELGRAVVVVRWQNDVFFLILPSMNFVSLYNFTYTKDGTTWDSQEILPKAFSTQLPRFQLDLEDAEHSFAPLREQWEALTRTARITASMARIRVASDTWREVQLPEQQKLELLVRAELFEKGDPAAPSGLLLSGPPGTGKTLLLRTLQETLDCNFQMLSPADLKQQNIGASGQFVREIWNRARSRRPAIIALDECEGILGRRGAPETDAISAEIVRTFLAEWQSSDDASGIWVIGTTNRRDQLDEAILSRFGWEMDLALPGGEERFAILKREITSVGITVDPPEEMIALTQGMNGRGLQNLAKSVRAIAYPEMPEKEHFLEAVRSARRAANTRVDRAASWDTLVLDEDTLERLKLTCALLRDAEHWRQQNVSIPRSLLLIGPPGVGKTEIGRTIANESGLTFLAATTADTKAPFSGWSGNRVRELFERARSSSPSVLFLDELDIIAPDRSLLGAADPLTTELVGQLLQEIDGIRAREADVFLLAATNHVDRIDPAILSRFRERIVIPLPDRDARVRLLSIMLSGKRINFSIAEGALLLANLVEGRNWSGRDLESWIGSAEQKALLRAVRGGGPDHYAITLDDFEVTPR